MRDAAAHVILGITMTKGAFAMSFLKSGFNFNKAMSRDAREFGARAPEVLVKELRDHADDRTLPPGVKPLNMLGDTDRPPAGLPPPARDAARRSPRSACASCSTR